MQISSDGPPNRTGFRIVVAGYTMSAKRGRWEQTTTTFIISSCCLQRIRFCVVVDSEKSRLSFVFKPKLWSAAAFFAQSVRS